jgi:uncharacterized protein (DUF433 family)
MTLAIDKESPPLRVDETGTVRVGDSRVTLDIIIGAFNLGHTAEAIAESYPSVTLADVYATISYYLRHRQQADAYLSQRAQEAEALRHAIEAKPEYQAWRNGLIAKLDARAKERGLRK